MPQDEYADLAYDEEVEFTVVAPTDTEPQPAPAAPRAQRRRKPSPPERVRLLYSGYERNRRRH